MADQIYNESMCEIAELVLGKGKTIARLATTLDVCRDTIYQWRDKHPEFARSLKKGRDAGQAHWEDVGEAGIKGEIKNFAGTSWMFTMKNRFRDDYKEEKEQKNDDSASVLERIITGEIQVKK